MLGVGRRICVCAVLFFASSALAEDFVLMKNGDRITGEVKKIWDEEVYINPPYGDEYAIELEYVAHVHTDEKFEVSMRHGRRTESVIGWLDLNEDGQAAVITDSGRTVPLAQVDNMLEIEEFFDWKILSDISANVAKGNTNTSSTRVYTLGELKLGEHRHRLELTRDEQRTDGEFTKDQSDVFYQDTWTFTDEWFVRGSINWTRDPIRDLDSRTRVFLGPGYHFWDDSKRTLNLSIGPTYFSEKIGLEQDDSLAVQSTLRYDQKFLRDDLFIFWQSDVTEIVKGRDNRIVESTLGLRYDITGDIYLTMQVDYNRESNPATDRQKEDVTFLFGAGIKLD